MDCVRSSIENGVDAVVGGGCVFAAVVVAVHVVGLTVSNFVIIVAAAVCT